MLNWGVFLVGYRICFRQSRVASLVHALIILPLAARCLHLPKLEVDRAFGWDPRVGTVFAVTSG